MPYNGRGSVRFRSSRAIAIAHLLACLVIGIIAVAFSRVATDSSIYALSLGLTAMLVWSLGSWWYVTGTVFDPYGMFISALFLFNAGQALLEVAGLNNEGLLSGRFDDDVLSATLYIVLLGLCFGHLGALTAASRSKATSVQESSTSGQALRATGWILLGISIVPTVTLLWDAASSVFAGGYMALYQRNAGTGIAAGPQVVSTFLVPAALFLLAGAKGAQRERLTAAAVIGCYTTIQFVLGYRSTAIMPVCAFVWLWDRCESRIRTRYLLGAATIATMVVLPISRETRMLVGHERLSFTTLVSSYVTIENPFVSTVSEMGGSMATVAYTYILVPSTRAFDHGIGYAYAALTVLPNLFWDIHPTISHGTASDWLIWSVDPASAAKQIGLGYSCIAEAYLNYGWVGVPIVMFVLGFSVAGLTAWGRHDRARMAMVAAFTAFALRFPRDEAASLVRAFVWYSWLPYMCATVMGGLGSRRSLVVAAGSNLAFATADESVSSRQD
jgi:oligosaccharide repeat unit polymerase